jgi:hypothetical protein
MTSDVGHKKCSTVYNITEFSASCATQSAVLLFFHTKRAVPSGRAVYDADLQPLASWDCGFQSRRGHGCLSVVSVVCCHCVG